MEDQNLKIKYINVVFKIVIISVLVIVFIIKIFTTTSKIEISNVTYTDLLSMILAMFAIGISVAFYFKSTDNSNKFYDNTYKFTSDISEILGRIEAGFGEKLKHLDEGYTGLRDKFIPSNFTSSSTQLSKSEIEDQVKEERAKLKDKLIEKDDLIKDLLNKAKLTEKEKIEYSKSLKEKEILISKLEKEINNLVISRSNDEKDKEAIIFGALPPSLRNILRDFIVQNISDKGLFFHKSADELIPILRLNIFEYSSSDISNLKRYGVIDDNLRFTKPGIEYLKLYAKRIT